MWMWYTISKQVFQSIQLLNSSHMHVKTVYQNKKTCLEIMYRYHIHVICEGQGLTELGRTPE
jgi:hypothetical protein